MEAFRIARPDIDDALDLEAFEAGLHGSIVLPGSPEYDEARQVTARSTTGDPALIVRAADAADVARTVALARESGLALSVRGGGHSLAGYGTNDGGIVLDLGAMKGLHIDPERRLAWAQPGLTAGEYTVAAAAHGLATPFGDTGSVGIAGLTLGGGIGWLVRKYGLAIDALEAVEIVTADGRAGHRQRGVAPGPVLGGPRWRRQLRRRDPLPVQALPGRRDPRRRAVHAGHPRRPAQPRPDRRERPRGADDDLVPDAPPARAVRPGRAGRHAVAGHHVRVVRRRSRPAARPRSSRSATSRRRSSTWPCRCRTRASTR